MVVAKPWRKPTGILWSRVLWTMALLAAAWAAVTVPLGPSWDTLELRTGLAIALFVASAVPLIGFLWLATKASRYRSLVVLDGWSWSEAAEPEPPFSPESTGRLGRWQVVRGRMPSAELWVLRRKTWGGPGRRSKVRVILGVLVGAGETPNMVGRRRLARYVEQMLRPVLARPAGSRGKG